MNTKLTGYDAITYAEAYSMKLIKSADAIEGKRYDVAVAEAREIAAQDPSLIYCYIINTRFYKVQGHGKKSRRGNRYQRYTIDRYSDLGGKMVFAESIAWHYEFESEALVDLLRIKREDEARGYSVEVL